jgi:undecaprenyl diphosphate synthase
MDGNGRWAKARGMIRSKGHLEGLKSTKTMVAHAATLGIPYLSLYTFSSENWSRAEEEVGALMNLLSTHLRAQIPFYKEHQIKVVHSGATDRLSKHVLGELSDIADLTAHHKGLVVNLLIDYGGQDEIIRALQRLQLKQLDINKDTLVAHLDQPDIPMLDCVIRSAGEQRLSNFMIWQAAYAELIYTDVLWPDFSTADFDLAMQTYAMRTRTFGGK